jgi:hypothetical protein
VSTVKRGNWGGGNSHGDTPHIVPLLRALDKLDKGQAPTRKLKARGFIEDGKITFEGKIYLERCRRILPIVFNTR